MVWPQGNTTSVHVSNALVGGFRTEDPRVPALQADCRFLQIEERQTETINASRSRLPHTVIDHEPAFRRFDGWRTQANFVRVPPTAAPRFENDFVTAPMAQVGRIGDPHMSAKSGHWPMDESPASANPMRQQRRVLILRRHDYAESIKAPEIFGERQGDPWAAAGKGGVGHRVLLEFRQIGDAWIFDAPDFLGIVHRICHQGGLGIDAPSADAHSANEPRTSATGHCGLPRGKAARYRRRAGVQPRR